MSLLYVNPNQVAFTVELTLDGQNYLTAAMEMIAAKQILVSHETYHSAGQQVLVAAIFRIFGISPFAVRIFNFLCYLAALGLIFLISNALSRSRTLALVAASLLAASPLVRYFCATLQYEIPVMTLFLFLLVCFLKKKHFLFGCMVGLLCFFRVHLPISTLPLWALIVTKRTSNDLRSAFAGLISFIFPIYLIYSVHFKSLSGFQSMPSGHLNKWLCLGAEGWNFPFYKWTPESICGADFVFGHPLEYLALVWRRTLYGLGIKNDVSWVPTFSIQSLEWNTVLSINAGWVMVFVVAFIFSAFKIYRSQNATQQAVAFVPIASFFPFLFVGASNRSLIPVLPFVVLTLVHGLTFFASIRSERLNYR